MHMVNYWSYLRGLNRSSMSKDVWMWLVDTTQRSGRYIHTHIHTHTHTYTHQLCESSITWLFKMEAVLCRDWLYLFFLLSLPSVQWPQQPQLSLQSCLGVDNWACAASCCRCCWTGGHESSHITLCVPLRSLIIMRDITLITTNRICSTGQQQ